MSKTTDQGERAAGPLAGVRIVDLTQFVLGPYATQTLGDLGADVIKVEEPSGDRQRTSGKAPNSPTMGPMFVAFNRNKRSVTLDLKDEAGRAALRQLIASADIFIHNMRPDSIARLGFAYDEVAKVKPDIIYVEAMGFDPAGPYAGRQAFDDLIQAASGACGLNAMVEPDATFRPLPTIIAEFLIARGVFDLRSWGNITGIILLVSGFTDSRDSVRLVKSVEGSGFGR